MARKQQIPEKFTGATVTAIRRASARLLLALPEVPLAGVVIGLQLWAGKLHIKIDAVWVVLCSVAFGVWLLINAVILLFQSRTIPALMLGFEYRSVETGQRAGGKAFLGRLLTALLFYATLGVMGILMAATYRNGQSVVDRWLGLVAIHPKRIRDVFDPAALVPPTPPARVQQVTMPGMTSSPPLSSPPVAAPGPQQPAPAPAAFAAAPFAGSPAPSGTCRVSPHPRRPLRHHRPSLHHRHRARHHPWTRPNWMRTSPSRPESRSVSTTEHPCCWRPPWFSDATPSHPMVSRTPAWSICRTRRCRCRRHTS